MTNKSVPETRALLFFLYRYKNNVITSIVPHVSLDAALSDFQSEFQKDKYVRHLKLMLHPEGGIDHLIWDMPTKAAYRWTHHKKMSTEPGEPKPAGYGWSLQEVRVRLTDQEYRDQYAEEPPSFDQVSIYSVRHMRDMIQDGLAEGNDRRKDIAAMDIAGVPIQTYQKGKDENDA